MGNPEKTEGAIKNGQSRENRRGDEEWVIQRKQKRRLRMDNLEILCNHCAQDAERRQTNQKTISQQRKLKS